VIVNLGCGKKPVKGMVNVDLYPFDGVDLVMDLDKKWDFESKSVDEIYAFHLVEHLDYVHFLEECLRALRVGGKVFLKVPYYTSNRSHIGEHKTAGFSWIAFDNIEKRWQEWQRFKVLKNRICFGKKLGFLNLIFNKTPAFYDRFLAHLIPAVELEVVLEKMEEKTQ